MTRILFSLALAALSGACARGDDWPRFRGPNGDGVARGAGYPVKWSESENVRWKAELPGKGTSSPVVFGGKVYVTAVTGYRQDRLHTLAFDLATGGKLWERTLWATGSTVCHPDTDMAAPTPAADAGGVYTLFATGDLAAFSPEGALRWYRSLNEDYGVSNQVGMASSILVADGKVIVPMDNAADSFLAALAAEDGRTLWKTPRPRDTNWVTPVVRDSEGRAELLYQTGEALVGYDPGSGEELWRVEMKMSGIPSTVAGGGRIYATGGGGVTALESSEPGAQPKEAWRAGQLTSGYSTPLLYGGRIYTVNRSGVLNCADADSGEIQWRARLAGAASASPVAAEGRVYVTGNDGVTTAVDAASGEVLSTNPLGEEVPTTPALVGGRVLIRTDKHLWCFGG